MTMTNPALIDAVRMLHNSLFVTSGNSLLVSSGRYRRLIRATTETNTEGSVCEDEIIALLIMREVASDAGWSSRKHAAEYSSTLARYAWRYLGALDVAVIDVPHVLAVLEQKVPASKGYPLARCPR